MSLPGGSSRYSEPNSIQNRTPPAKRPPIVHSTSQIRTNPAPSDDVPAFGSSTVAAATSPTTQPQSQTARKPAVKMLAPILNRTCRVPSLPVVKLSRPESVDSMGMEPLLTAHSSYE